MAEGGRLHRDGRVKSGDRIVEVNDLSLNGLTYARQVSSERARALWLNGVAKTRPVVMWIVGGGRSHPERGRQQHRALIVCASER